MMLLIYSAAIITLVIITIGVALHDLRMIRVERMYRQHPHARKWRARPTVTVISAHTVSSLHQSYRKLQIAAVASDSPTLRVPQHTRLPHDSVRHAVRFLAIYPTRFVPLFPTIATPSTTRELFWSTYLLLAAPFAAMRAGLGVQPHPDFPVLQPQASYSYGFACTAWIARCVNLVCFSYALFLATFLEQPALLLGYSVAFSAWALWAIGRYPFIRFTQKILFAMLLPAALIYFLWRLIVAPLRFPILAAVAYSHPKTNHAFYPNE